MRKTLVLALAAALPLGGLALGGLALGGLPLGGLALSGCRSASHRGRGTAPRSPEPRAHPATGAFEGMRRAFASTRVPRERNDAARLRTLNPLLANAGLALLRAPPPHDLERSHHERFLEGRTVFGEALRQWVSVVVSGSDADVLASYDALADAFRGWGDAAQGRNPERSV